MAWYVNRIIPFIYGDAFDEKMAEMMMNTPNFLDSDKQCPTNDQYDTSNYYNVRIRPKFNEYTDHANDPDILKFLRFYCNKPSVISKIENRIKEDRKMNEPKAADGWERAKELLQSSS